MALSSLNLPAPAPISLSGDIAGNWRAFRTSWEFYEEATGLCSLRRNVDGAENVDGLRRIAATLLTVIGPEALNVFTNLPNTTDADRTDPDKVIQLLENHFLPQRHVLFERYKFNCANQLAGENIDAYVMRLRCLAKSCEFSILHDSLLRDRIVIGTRDASTRDRLLRERPVPDLKRCVEMLQANELSQHHKSQFLSNTESSNIEHVSKQRAVGRDETNKGSYRQCGWCGRRGSYNYGQCPARSAICGKCGKVGHYRKVCRGRNNHSYRKVEDKVLYEENSCSHFLGTIVAVDEVYSDWSATVSVNGIPTLFKLGTTTDIKDNV